MSNVKAYFTNIRNEILKILDNSESSIQICMAWLTDKVLMSKLIEKHDEGIEVEICIFDHDSNKKKIADVSDKLKNLSKFFADLKGFQDKGGKLNIIPQNLYYLHHKFAVIDSKITITGSYNWTAAAMTHKENIVVIEDIDVAKQYQEHMNEIISVSHQNIIDAYFDKCTCPNCPGRILEVKLVDFRHTTKYFQNDTLTIGYCTEDIEHLTIISDNTESDYIADMIEYEYNLLDDELQDREFKNKDSIVKRRIESNIAWSLNSRLDVLVDYNSHKILGLYKIVKDIDGNEELKAIWEHDLIKPYFLEAWENEIIVIIDMI